MLCGFRSTWRASRTVLFRAVLFQALRLIITLSTTTMITSSTTIMTTTMTQAVQITRVGQQKKRKKKALRLPTSTRS